MKKYNHLDKFGRLPVSVEPRLRKVFNDALNYAKRAGFNRSKFIVMAVIMAALDLGMENENDNNKT